MKHTRADEQRPAAPAGDQAPAIFSVRHVDGQPLLSRRSFFELAVALAGTAAVSSRGVQIRTLQSMRPALAHSEPVTALAVNASGRLLASGDKGGTIKVWQLPEGALLKSWTEYQSPITALAFPHLDDTLWSLDTSRALKAWRLPSGTKLATADGIRERGNLGALLAVPSAGVWYAMQADERVELRSQADGELLTALGGLDDKASALAATPDGHVLMVGGEHGNLGLWVESQGNRLQTVKTGSATVSALALAPNGTRALSLHADGVLRIWHLPELRAGTVFESTLGKPCSGAIRPQLDYFAVGSEEPRIGLWGLAASGVKPRLLEGHVAAVRALAITPDGSLLISGSDDKTIRLWSLPEGKPLRNLVDLASNYKSFDGMSYKGMDVYGRLVVFTLPCGSPLPPGAVCACNCVPGSLEIPRSHAQKFNTEGYCSCDLVCTCNLVPAGAEEGRGFLGGRGNRRPSSPGGSSSRTYCSCVPVCTCQSVVRNY